MVPAVMNAAAPIQTQDDAIAGKDAKHEAHLKERRLASA